MKFALLCKENRIFPSDQRPGLLATVDIGAGIASTGIPFLFPVALLKEHTCCAPCISSDSGNSFGHHSAGAVKRASEFLWHCTALRTGQGPSPNSEIQHSVRQESVGSLSILMSWKKYNFLKKTEKDLVAVSYLDKQNLIKASTQVPYML